MDCGLEVSCGGLTWTAADSKVGEEALAHVYSVWQSTERHETVLGTMAGAEIAAAQDGPVFS